MPDSFNPIENEGSLGNPDPLDDPMLNALEKSLENPPSFIDSLIENDEPFMDDLARQLGAVEACIENAPPVPPESRPREPGGDRDGNEPDVQGNEPITSEAVPISDDDGSPEVAEHLWGQSDGPPPHLQESSSRTPQPNPPDSRMLKRGSGRSGSKKGPPSLRRIRGKTGLFISKQKTRYCPESREVIYIDRCDDCEKHRHWPEGTNEEPKECWYDWQAQSLNDDSKNDSVGEY
jgi:hypothetical protein